jgi:MFS family permease
MIGFGMIFPLLPIFKIEFLLTDLQVGYIASIFAVFSLFGTLFFGILCDKFGRKYTLSIALLLGGIVYFLTGYSQSYMELLIYRGLSGFLTSCFVITFAITSDISDDSNKFRYMGILGAAFSLGFILGPAIGGYLAGDSNNIDEINLAMPFVVAGAVSLLAGVLSIIFLRETLSKEDRSLEKQANLVQSIKELYTNKKIVLFTYLTILLSLVMAGIEVYLSVWLNENFNLTARDMGYYWGLFGAVITISQLALPRFFSAKQALIGGFLIFGLSCLLLLFATNIYILIILSIFMAMGMGIIFPSINVNLAISGAKNEQGLIFGVNQSFGNLGRIIGPYALGWMFFISPNAVWIAIAVICLLTALLVLQFLEKESKQV